MRNAEAVLGINNRRAGGRENCHVRFGGGRTEKEPQGHLAGRLPYCEQAASVPV
jgi:hypothetical protein